MKKVIYNTCVLDPWLNVAKKLCKENNFEPIYWIGYSYDHSRIEVPSTFPNITYQSTEDAWKGVFPKEIEDIQPYYYVDVDFLRSISVNELQAISMMNRIDFTSYDFNFMERERHFLKLMKSWLAVIDKYKPDLVISAVFPHRVYDYVLYLICRKMNIPFIMFQYSMVSGRIYCLDEITSMHDMLAEEYAKCLNRSIRWGDIPEDIRMSRERVLSSDYDKAEPLYMKKNKQTDKKFSGLFSKAKRYIQKRHLQGEPVKWKNQNACFKKRGVLLEENYQTLFSYWWDYGSARSRKIDLKKYYDSKVTRCNQEEKYIYFPLHYQPENTTAPAGDIFANQYLCVETVLKNTPEDVFVYVKEHPSQFMSQFLGQTSRIREFYNDLAKNKRVRLISIDENPFVVMKNAIAVMTVTGTVGWEAMCNRKPVVIFGSVWYEKYEGVLRVVDKQSAMKINDFISQFKYDEHKLQAYLLAFAKKSIKAYHYRGYKLTSNVSEEESVRNISNKILEMVC